MGKSKTNQQSIDLRYQGYNPQYKLGGHNISMLLDDLSFSKYDLKDELITVSVNPDIENQLEKSIRETFPISKDSWNTNLSDSLFDFFSLISSKIVHEGFCVFEKVTIIDETQSDLVYLKLINGDLEIKKTKIIQNISKEQAERIGCKTKITIEKEKCFIIDFPDKICSRKSYLKILKEIKKIDAKDPMFSILNPTPLNGINGYDTLTHRRYLDLVLWNLTKKISWHHRSQFSQKEIFSNYYLTLRDLKFKRTKLIFMNHIFRFIERVIEELFQETITIIYFKDISDIDQLISDFMSGNFTNKDYLKAISDYHS